MVDNADHAHQLAVDLEKLEGKLSTPMRRLGEEYKELDDWLRSLRQRIVPRLKGEIPLIVGLCGGGNAGKSTLFNALVGREASVASPKAGLTRRALLAIPTTLFDERRDLLEILFHSFGGMPEPLPESGSETSSMCEPGPPLYILTDAEIRNTVLVDMPDMDVAGNDGGYANRENAKKVLAACDVLVMLASNTTYNSKDIAEFMRSTVSDNGQRSAILIYRYARPKTERGHIDDVFKTMTRNLCPDNCNPPVIGRFVFLDDPGISDGSSPLKLIPERVLSQDDAYDDSAGVAPLWQALADVDNAALGRRDTIANIEDGLRCAHSISDTLRKRLQEIQNFHAAVVSSTPYKAKTSLTEYPFEEFRSLAAELWQEEQNVLLKIGRGFGRVAKSPITFGKYVIARLVSRPTSEIPSDWTLSATAFLENAADLLNQLQTGHLHTFKEDKKGKIATIIDSTVIEPPEAFSGCTAAISGDGYFSCIKSALDTAWIEAVQLPDNARDVLRPIIKDARKNMSSLDVVKEYGACVANIALPILAVGYVLSTGDVATGSVLGVLEVSDIAAVVVVPAVYGSDYKGKKWLQDGLNAVVGHWSAIRAPALDAALRKTVSGGFIEKGKDLIEALTEPVKLIEDAIRHVELSFTAWAGEGENHD